MTSLALLPDVLRAHFSLWALLLCLAAIFGCVLAMIQKRYGFAALTLLPFSVSFFLWQVLDDFRSDSSLSEPPPISSRLTAAPWILWTAVLGILTLTVVLLQVREEVRGKNQLTPQTIKICLDRMPCGICYWRDSGRILFSNICMNRLCTALTREPLLNGNHFRAAIPREILNIDGKVWRFVCRDTVFNGECLHEMIASDISAEYARTETLERDKAALSRLNRELQEYNLGIDDMVRRQEVLQAKISIHDEMNRLMLTTVATDAEDTAEMDQVFALWEQNSMLLCREAEEKVKQKSAEYLRRLERALGIRLVWNGELPEALTAAQKNLFFAAAQESMANAVKHAEAEELKISFAETETAIRCDLTNGGKVPSGTVSFSGGLANLNYLAKEQGVSVTVKTGETFTLSLNFPKNS